MNLPLDIREGSCKTEPPPPADINFWLRHKANSVVLISMFIEICVYNINLSLVVPLFTINVCLFRCSWWACLWTTVPTSTRKTSAVKHRKTWRALISPSTYALGIQQASTDWVKRRFPVIGFQLMTLNVCIVRPCTELENPRMKSAFWKSGTRLIGKIW